MIRSLMARMVLAFTLASMLFGYSVATDRHRATGKDSSIFQSSSTVVLVGAKVRDRRQNLVRGLSADDFSVFDRGKQQSIKYFSEEQTPVSLLVIYDTSASMSSFAQETARAVKHLFTGPNRDDEFALILFAGGKQTLVPWTSNEGGIEGSLMNTCAKGSTGLFDAMNAGLTYLKTATHVRKAMVVISDGQDNDSRLTGRELIGRMSESDIEVYAISPKAFESTVRSADEQGNAFTPLAVLEEICERTSGIFYSTTEGNSGVAAAATDISDLIRSSYVLGFEVPADAIDGRFHRLRVTLRGRAHRSFEVIARRSYRAAQLDYKRQPWPFSLPSTNLKNRVCPYFHACRASGMTVGSAVK